MRTFLSLECNLMLKTFAVTLLYSVVYFLLSGSFIIDDGTSTSFVTCCGTQVADLLDLDPAQWTALTELVKPVGEILYSIQSVCMAQKT